MSNESIVNNISWKLFLFLGVTYVGFAGWSHLQAQPGEPAFIIDAGKPGANVASICRGQQIEEFNYQFEGGLYAQLIHNPSFEELGDPTRYWSLETIGKSSGKIKAMTSKETSLLNEHQQHCLELTVSSVVSGNVKIVNGGYWGIRVENDTAYSLSFWAKKDKQYAGKTIARIESNSGVVYASSPEFDPSEKWEHFTCSLVAKGVPAVRGDNRLVIEATAPGKLYFDVITLMPPTWKNRPNGLRPDLARRLEALKIRYIQFPGGCTSESSSMDTCWNWKNSIGPVELRAGSTRNRWGYKNDLYFGLDEYLQLCEDLGAEPVYTTSAGISESRGSKQWFGLCPLDKMQPIIDDILDLIEYCNGAVSTRWGALRAANGHPEPYHLWYLEIGNENAAEWSGTKEDYIPRYKLIHDAIAARYPEMKFMYNGVNGTSERSETSGNTVDYVDEHFYLNDVSLMYDKYDSINAECKKICVAEYASSTQGNGGNVTGNFGDALADAAFMLGCEKNSARMWWTGYGNYAGLTGHGNFGPCLVWNDAVTSFVTPSYYMEKILFADNQGSRVLPFVNRSFHCVLSATLDTADLKQDILLKVVNKSDSSETIRIRLEGASQFNPLGNYTMLSADKGAENSLEHPDRVTPVYGTFPAGEDFLYTFPANSITVLGIKP